MKKTEKESEEEREKNIVKGGMEEDKESCSAEKRRKIR